MKHPVDIAVARFKKQFSCSQSVLSSLAPQLGITDEFALKLASPFGGGFARQGHVCGAVTSALMAIGLKYGTTTPEGKEEIYKIAQEFIHQFEKKHDSIICRQLIGFDISTTEGFQRGKESGIFTTICPSLVKDAVEIASALIGQS